MTINPLVSVIITTYCRPQILKITLESVLNQTYKNIEIIVVDDGSPSNENELVIKSLDSKIQYFKINNSGRPPRSRNFGYSKSKGKYVAFLDDDDIWRADKIAIQVAILEENPEYGLVHSYCDVIDQEGKLTNKSIGRPKSPTDKHGDVKMKMLGNWTLMMPSPLIRASVVEKVGLFDEELVAAEDVHFFTRCSFYTKFYYVDMPLAYYRLHGNNISSRRGKLHVFNPTFLKSIIDTQLKLNNINQQEYQELFQNLMHSQIKYLKKYFRITIKQLFSLDKLWFLKYKNVKMFLFILTKR